VGARESIPLRPQDSRSQVERYPDGAILDVLSGIEGERHRSHSDVDHLTYFVSKHRPSSKALPAAAIRR